MYFIWAFSRRRFNSKSNCSWSVWISCSSAPPLRKRAKYASTCASAICISISSIAFACAACSCFIFIYSSVNFCWFSSRSAKTVCSLVNASPSISATLALYCFSAASKSFCPSWVIFPFCENRRFISFTWSSYRFFSSASVRSVSSSINAMRSRARSSSALAASFAALAASLAVPVSSTVFFFFVSASWMRRRALFSSSRPSRSCARRKSACLLLISSCSLAKRALFSSAVSTNPSAVEMAVIKSMVPTTTALMGARINAKASPKPRTIGSALRACSPRPNKAATKSAATSMPLPSTEATPATMLPNVANPLPASGTALLTSSKAITNPSSVFKTALTAGCKALIIGIAKSKMPSTANETACDRTEKAILTASIIPATTRPAVSMVSVSSTNRATRSMT